MKKRTKYLIFLAGYLLPLLALAPFAASFTKGTTGAMGMKVAEKAQQAEAADLAAELYISKYDNSPSRIYIYFSRNLAVHEDNGKCKIYKVKKQSDGQILLTGYCYAHETMNNFVTGQYDTPPEDCTIDKFETGGRFCTTGALKYCKDLKMLGKNAKTLVDADALTLVSEQMASNIDVAKQQAAERQAQKAKVRQLKEAGKGNTRIVFYILVPMVIVSLILALIAWADGKETREDTAHTPQMRYEINEEGTFITATPVLSELSPLNFVLEYGGLAIVVIFFGALCIPKTLELLQYSVFENFFAGAGFIILTFVILMCLFVVFSNLNDRVAEAEGTTDHLPLSLMLIEWIMVLIFSIIGLIMLPFSPIPLIVFSVYAVLPGCIIEWKCAQKRTALHCFQPLNRLLFHSLLSIIIAAIMCYKVYKMVVDFARRGAEIEERREAEARAAEGDIINVHVGNGDLLTLERIGNSDEFNGSDGHRYRKAAGSNNIHGLDRI